MSKNRHCQESLTLDRLKQAVSYNPETGAFVRLLTRGCSKRGDVLGWANRDGYLLAKVDGQEYMLHRLAWFYMYGAWPKHEIDHINGVRHDNRIVNLRDVTKSVNQQNRKGPQQGASSAYLGVSYFKETGRWRAQIKINGKKKSIGYFSTEEEAYTAYLEVKRQLHEGNTL
ncbi:hypothetical protein IP84_16840 [beta proteobacterium AAP99]|nr:hypothetical protein IP84_16840 [beta proteobacterium AAP99]